MRPTRLDPPPPLEFSSNGTFKLVHAFQLAHHETRVRFLIVVDAVNVTRHIHDFGNDDEAGFEILVVHKSCRVDIYLNENF